MAEITIKPYRTWMRVLDWLMVPVMYLTQGTVWEVPQQTHRWNNQKSHAVNLDTSYCLSVTNDSQASSRYLFGFIPLFHIPILGGWRDTVVLHPSVPPGWHSKYEWHVGWVLEDGRIGVSLVPLRGPVRVTLGLGESKFYAFTASGHQIALRLGERGLVGAAGDSGHLPLL